MLVQESKQVPVASVFQENVHLMSVVNEVLKTNDELVMEASMQLDFLGDELLRLFGALGNSFHSVKLVREVLVRDKANL